MERGGSVRALTRNPVRAAAKLPGRRADGDRGSDEAGDATGGAAGS
nr:hypothetical protein [Paenibacillus rubinfantis]